MQASIYTSIYRENNAPMAMVKKFIRLGFHVRLALHHGFLSLRYLRRFYLTRLHSFKEIPLNTTDRLPATRLPHIDAYHFNSRYSYYPSKRLTVKENVTQNSRRLNESIRFPHSSTTSINSDPLLRPCCRFIHIIYCNSLCACA